MSSSEERYVPVCFEISSKRYTFEANGLDLHINDKVVVETKKGLELGKVVDEPSSESGLREGFEIKKIIRKADDNDIYAHHNNLIKAKQARLYAQKEADNLDLKMNFITSEYTLDSQKITLTYLADNRVDFRELLKVLAAHLHCRIDLRQIGARDKAKMVGGIGICGRELCCKVFLNDFERISINMAKNQSLALNISKLSGQCGALMCCLKYEDDAYQELRTDLPKIGAKVEYEGAVYKIISLNILERSCKIENNDHVLEINVDELFKKAKFSKSEHTCNCPLRSKNKIIDESKENNEVQEAVIPAFDDDYE